MISSITSTIFNAKNRYAAIFILTLACAYATYCLTQSRGTVYDFNDASSYINMIGARWALYPLLIKIIGLENMHIAQILLFSLSCSILGLTLLYFFNRFLSTSVTTLIFSHTYFIEFHDLIMSESIFSSTNMVFLSILAIYANRPQTINLAALSLMSSITAGIRNIGLSSSLPLLGLAFLMKLPSTSWGKRLLILILPFAAGLFIQAGIKPFLKDDSAIKVQGQRPYNQYSIIGSHLYAKAAVSIRDEKAFLVKPLTTSQIENDVIDALKNTLRPVRDLIRKEKGRVSDFWQYIYEYCLFNNCWSAFLTQYEEEKIFKERSRAGFFYLNRNLVDYINAISIHYLALIQFIYPPPYLVHDIKESLSRLSPLPLGLPVYNLFSQLVPEYNWKAYVVHIGMTIIGIVTAGMALLGLIAVAYRPGRFSPLAIMAFAPAIAAHSYYLVSSMIAISQSRYTLPMWPMLITSFLAGLILISKWLTSRFRSNESV